MTTDIAKTNEIGIRHARNHWIYIHFHFADLRNKWFSMPDTSRTKEIHTLQFAMYYKTNKITTLHAAMYYKTNKITTIYERSKYIICFVRILFKTTRWMFQEHVFGPKAASWTTRVMKRERCTSFRKHVIALVCEQVSMTPIKGSGESRKTSMLLLRDFPIPQLQDKERTKEY